MRISGNGSKGRNVECIFGWCLGELTHQEDQPIGWGLMVGKTGGP